MRRDVKFMEEKAFRRSRELSSTTQSKEEPMVQPQQLASENSVASPRHSDPKDVSLEDLKEGEPIDLPTTSGRTSRELRQILKDAEDFVGIPRNEKRLRKQPERYQALVAQVEEPSSFREAAQHHVWVDAMMEGYSSIMTNDV